MREQVSFPRSSKSKAKSVLVAPHQAVEILWEAIYGEQAAHSHENERINTETPRPVDVGQATC